MHISVALEINNNLLPSLQALHDSLNEKCGAFKDIIKVGRTHMQDAVPLTLGQELNNF